MSKSPDRGNLSFNPPMKPGTDQFVRAWEIIMEMGHNREIVFYYEGQGWIKALSFPTKEDAMMFRLRL